MESVGCLMHILSFECKSDSIVDLTVRKGYCLMEFPRTIPQAERHVRCGFDFRLYYIESLIVPMMLIGAYEWSLDPSSQWFAFTT